jgi:23S rRNA (pseudouridine1915-N3)-methyltransferase
MLRIKIIAVGKLRERHWADAVQEYAKRLSRFCALEILETAEESVPPGAGDALIERHLKTESGRLLEKVREGAFLTALDLNGENPDSPAFARKLQDLMGRRSELLFVIGGSWGLHADVLARTDYRLSLSNMTFPHQLARLLLAEQLYRAFKIIGGEVYHK